MALLTLAVALLPFQPAFAPLWQIGAPDGTGAEFAFAPGGYRKYGRDPLFVVGASRTDDWPYVLPGPVDSWAGSRAHAATVVFGLERASAGRARLRVDLVETHSSAPPLLTLWLNGKRAARWQAPAGNGDAAIEGRPETGRPATWSVELPQALLRKGNNALEIRSESGSWVLFDALTFETDRRLALGSVQPELRFEYAGSDAALYRSPSGTVQRLRFSALNLGGEATVRATAPGAATEWRVPRGRSLVELSLPVLSKPRRVTVKLDGPRIARTVAVAVKPPKPWTIYLIPHSHVDVGYTNLQPEVEVIHRNTLFQALELMEESKGLSPEAQFRWTVEAAWVLDKFLASATSEERDRVFAALRSGRMEVTGAYANILSGLARPEELLRTFSEAVELRKRSGARIEAVSQTDVPGMARGIVPAMCQAGLKYLAFWPNPSDRIGGARHFWEDRPFYWVGPSGEDRVLAWPMATYALGHWAKGLIGGERFKMIRTPDPTQRFIDSFIFDRLADLERRRYPYDLVAFTWSLSDNCPVDGDLPQAVQAWNRKYASPRVVLATAGDAFRALESRYASKIPTVRGDFSPYWEDGAGSSARETAMNRQTVERLLQAETLQAMVGAREPERAAGDAWKNAILYTEHTWGAYNSISEPDLDFVMGQWAIKKGFADQASATAASLLPQAVEPVAAAYVANTSSWARTGLVSLGIPPAGWDQVQDDRERAVPSQRLSTGELVALASDVPPFGTATFRAVPGVANRRSAVAVDGLRIVSPELELEINPTDGSISHLVSKRLGRDIVDRRGPHRLNQYWYLPGTDLAGLQPAGKPRIEVVENGPLVAVVRIVSQAPGARGLVRTLRVVAGLEQVEMETTIDKLPIRAKEGIHLAFPFDVPDGQMRIDNAWGVLRPEIDQLPGANRNWLNAQRWVDVSNGRFGVTTAVLDAPLMQVGGITANLLGAVGYWQDWIQRLPKSQAFYSWVMNNHWHTNYRAEQDGPVTFRYVVRPHRRFDPVEAARFGVECSQPLVPTVGPIAQLLRLDNPRVAVSALKPSEDGRAIVVRLWGASGKPEKVRLLWREGEVRSQWVSNLAEDRLVRCPEEVLVPGWGVVTVRAERMSR